MQAKIQWINNTHFIASADSGHEVFLDGTSATGGKNLGFRPMELMLVGLGGCTSFDVVSILAKSRQNVVDCVTEITAERATDVPHVFESIHITFKVSGKDLNESKVARAVSLSAEKYCSASIMLARGGVKITHDYEILTGDAFPS